MITKLFYSGTALKYLVVFTFFIFSTSVFSQNEFITTWKTDNPGTSNDTSITIPTTGTGYSYDVDWDNDGTFDEFGLTGNVTHDFTSAGIYTIRIQGDFPRIHLKSSLDKPKILSIEQWGTIAWVSMKEAFFGTSNLVVNATDAPDLSGVTDMSYMFSQTASFNQDISSWNTSTITDMSYMFYLASAFNNGGQALSWDTTALTNTFWMFREAPVFNQDLSTWNIGNVTNLTDMFLFASAYNNGGVPLNWTTTGVTNLSGLFSSATAFNQDISSWDISNVTNFAQMFNFATIYNNGGQPLTWDTTGITGLTQLFKKAFAFNQDISSWNVESVTNFTEMFKDATVFNNGGQPLNWNTIAATGMNVMFSGATVFNQDISSFNTSLVTDVSWMFQNAAAFNQDIGSWNVSKVTTLHGMFDGASAFNNGGQPINWDTSNVTAMGRVFRNDTAFNQDIGGWNVVKVSNFGGMFIGAALSDANYDALLIGWNAQNLSPNEAFDGGNSQYCTMAAQTARTNMINNDGWTITDGGLFSGTCGVLGIEDNVLDSILLFPNPVKDVLYVQSKNILERIMVYDINGRVMQDIVVSGTKTQENISLTNLSTGIYFVNVHSDKGQLTKKIIKE